MAVVNVSGRLGTRPGKHVLLPSVFFEAGKAPLFAETQRQYAVDFRFPFMIQDQFRMTLPANVTVENLPEDGNVPFAPNADYLAKFASNGRTFGYGRLLRIANFHYETAAYPSLHGFFQKVSSADHSELVLRATPEMAGAAGN